MFMEIVCSRCCVSSKMHLHLQVIKKKKIKGTHFPCFYANLRTCLSFCLYHMTSMVFSCTINDSVICVQSAKSLKGN